MHRKLERTNTLCAMHAWEFISRYHSNYPGTGARIEDSGLISCEVNMLEWREDEERNTWYLKECEGARFFLLMTGIVEITCLSWSFQELPFKEPLTHPLLSQLLQATGGRIKRALILDRNEPNNPGDGGSYRGALDISHEGDSIRIAARPSDAIHLATISPPAPIMINEKLLQPLVNWYCP